jgi:ABC-type oligopeptide transport system substrate-binding subunit
MGDASVDDLGVSAIETYVLEIEFEKKIDLDEFFKKTASIALVPLRESIVKSNDNWAKKASSLITNGPFDVKELSNSETIRLERSAYYYRDTEDNGPLDEYVIPYRIISHYDTGDLSDQLDAFLSGKIFYLGEIPLASRAEYAEYANAADYPATHTYYFNENNELLSNPDVRRALSMAIDRQAVAEIVTFAEPATGIIPPIIHDADGGSFREVGGELISTSADLSGAKSLLSSAGVRGGELTISIRNDEVDQAVAEYVKGVWEELGFDVDIKVLRYSTDADDSTIVIDNYYNDYINGNFDVIAVDMTVLTSDAFSALAPFAKQYSGYGVNMEPEEDPDANGNEQYLYQERGHVTGYDNEEYTALFDKYFETTDLAERVSILHDAEKMLIDDSVVMPLYFMQDHFMFSDVLSHLGSNYYGRYFNNMKMDDYMAYKTENESVLNSGNKD